jgi:hypothetical protein
MIPIRHRSRLVHNRIDPPAASSAGRKGIAFWRERWLHEDDLINHRLTWLLVAQTILFAGCATLLALLFDGDKALTCDNRENVLHTVRYVIPWVGMAIAFSIGLGVAGALASMHIIHRKANEELPDSFEYGIHWLPSVLGQVAGAFLPLLFAGVWLYLVHLFGRLA